MMRNKYGAKKSGGYDSKRERKRAGELAILAVAGEIENLKKQVRFELIPNQRGADGKVVERKCEYIADFTYFTPEGEYVVEDSKGFPTKDYIIKRKLMLFVHGIKVKQV